MLFQFTNQRMTSENHSLNCTHFLVRVSVCIIDMLHDMFIKILSTHEMEACQSGLRFSTSAVGACKVAAQCLGLLAAVNSPPNQCFPHLLRTISCQG